MREIDLIPPNYHEAKRVRRLWTRLFISNVAVVIVIGALWWHLGAKIQNVNLQLDELRVEKNSVIATRNRIDTLKGQRDELVQELRLLERLRGGPPVQSVFQLVDQALTPELWFMEWRFRRAGEQVQRAPPPGRSTGLIVLNDQSAPEPQSQDWRVRTHMEIRARTVSHETLAAFVSRMSGEPIVQDVRVLNTRRQQIAGKPSIESELAIVIGDDSTGG